MITGRFLPCTRRVYITKNVSYRPIRSWHTGCYAGEGFKSYSKDGSGCLKDVQTEFGPSLMCNAPKSAIHRAYSHSEISGPDEFISAFLSYPNGMGFHEYYFWEIFPAPGGDVERFSGDSAEEKMEARVVRLLNALARKAKRKKVTLGNDSDDQHKH